MASTVNRKRVGLAQQRRDVLEDDAGRGKSGMSRMCVREPGRVGRHRRQATAAATCAPGAAEAAASAGASCGAGAAWVSEAGVTAVGCGPPSWRPAPDAGTPDVLVGASAAGWSCRLALRRRRRRASGRGAAGRSAAGRTARLSPALQHGEDRRGDEDRRVGAGEQADEQGEGELLEGDGARGSTRRRPAARAPGGWRPGWC